MTSLDPYSKKMDAGWTSYKEVKFDALRTGCREIAAILFGYDV